jgi:hypothetical protein
MCATRISLHARTPWLYFSLVKSHHQQRQQQQQQEALVNLVQHQQQQQVTRGLWQSGRRQVARGHQRNLERLMGLTQMQRMLVILMIWQQLWTLTVILVMKGMLMNAVVK